MKTDGIDMILTANEIQKNVHRGDIIIDPFDPINLGTVSYKFKLSNLICPVLGPLDPKYPDSLVFQEIPQCGYVLEPGVFYLAQTVEIMGSNVFAQQIFALRDVGSAGIFIDISANLGHAGAITRWTLEITTDQRVLIFPFQYVGQIIFLVQLGTHMLYNGDYQAMECSLPSKQWKEF